MALQTGTTGDNTISWNDGLSHHYDGQAGNDTIIGDILSDTLIGSEGNDSISGNAGNDYLYGGDDDDKLYGGEGNDYLYGEYGADTIYGDNGNDYIRGDSSVLYSGYGYLDGGNGNDTIIGGYFGHDTILGGAGNDYITVFSDSTVNGGDGNDYIVVDDGGNNTIDGGLGIDTINGDDGDDVYWVDDSRDVVIDNKVVGFTRKGAVYGNAGTDVVHSTASSYALSSYIENLVLEIGAITGIGNALANTITGNALANTIDGGAGADTLVGGAGDDVYIVDNENDVIIENSMEGSDTVKAYASYTLGANVEYIELQGKYAINATGNGYANNMVGNIANNVLDGAVGDDRIFGLAGNDTLIGGTGNDYLEGGVGVDTYVYDSGDGDDTIVDSGANIIRVGSGIRLHDFSLNTVSGSDIYGIVNVGEGSIKVEGDIRGSSVIFSDGLVVNLSYASTLYANIGNNTDNNNAGIYAGNNFIFGVDGGSVIKGFVGNDFIGGKADDDSLSGDEGNDTLIGGDGSNTIDGGIGNDLIYSSSATDLLIGGDGDDVYVVETAGYTIVEDVDAIAYDKKNRPYVLKSNDTVKSYLTSTSLHQNVENLTLLDSAVTGIGNSDSNVITGNELGNVLDGGAGIDILVGGLGDDVYKVDNSSDVINDFVIVGYDKKKKPIYADAGVDTVVSTASSYSLGGFVENLELSTGAVTGVGNGLANIIVGNDSGNVLSGGADSGADTVEGGLGDDTIIYYANDYVDGKGGRDTVIISTDVDLSSNLDSIENVENAELSGKYAITAIGSSDANVLTGNAYNNVLSGGGGNDTLVGGLGVDTYLYNTGDGNDTIVDTGVNVIQFGANVSPHDVWFERSSSDLTIHAGSSKLTVQGDITGTRFVFDDGMSLTYNKNYQILRPNDTTPDELQLTGNEYIFGVDISTSKLYGFAGNDYINGLDYNTGAPGVFETIDGGLGDDTLIGGNGKKLIDGGLGNDIIYSKNATDSLIGGYGNDVYVVQTAGYTIVEDVDQMGLDKKRRPVLLKSYDTVKTYITSTTLHDNIENLTLLGSAVTGVGNASSNVITGNSLNNTLDGGAGIDVLVGGLGNDIYKVDESSDVINDFVITGYDRKKKPIYADAGVDTVISTASSYALGSFVENLTLSTGAIAGTGNAWANTITGNSGNNFIDGGAGNDYLDGGAGNDIIYGGLGNDIIYGGSGNNTLVGGAGDDIYHVSNQDDYIDETTIYKKRVVDTGGLDMVYSSVTYTLGNYVENLTLQNGSAINGYGNAWNNYILGNASSNHLYGYAGNDTLFGGNDVAVDSLYGGLGDDTYVYRGASYNDGFVEQLNEGSDTVFSYITADLAGFSNIENITLAGSNGLTTDTDAINATGNNGANVINGNAGNNTINGKQGNDLLIGNGGDDTYVFNLSDGYDVVSDSLGTDTITISGVGKEYVVAYKNYKDKKDQSIYIDYGVTAGTNVIKILPGTSIENIQVDGETISTDYINSIVAQMSVFEIGKKNGIFSITEVAGMKNNINYENMLFSS